MSARSMLGPIAAFEIRYQLRSPLFGVGCAIFFLLTFGSVTVEQIQIGGKGNVNVNSPFAILQTTGVMSIFFLFIATAFVANVVIRDEETGFAPILRATRVRKLDYLLGRFLGATCVSFVALACVPLAMLIGSWMPWLDAEKVGPFVLSHYLFALFVQGLPTLLVLGAGFFALATATRSMIWTYVGAVAFLVGFITSRILLSDPAYHTVSALADPFGLTAFLQATRYWTAAERNTQLPRIEGLLLANRLLWLGASGGLFALAYGLFRFEGKGAKPASAKQDEEAAGPAPALRPLASPDASAATRWRQFLALTRFDIAFVFRSPAFFVLLAIGALNAFGRMTGVVEFRGTPFFPVTRVIIQALVGSFNVTPIIVAVYYAGELVWRDRERRIHEIVDATAAPDWAFMVPKVLAIALVLLSTFVVAVATGALFQLGHGYARLELAHYLSWFVVPSLVSAFLLAVLSVFVQALVPQKFAGWAVMLLYLVASITLATLGFEHNLYNYGGEPNVPLSDMNGTGRFWIGRAWFQVYWLAFAAMLLVLSHLLWRRGIETRLAPRFARLRGRLAGSPGLLLGGAAAVWLGTGGFIYANTNVLNRYRTQPQEEDRLAELEKTLLPFEALPQPTIVEVKLAVQLFPRQARAATQGSYRIENRTGAPLAALHLRWARPLQLLKLEVPGGVLQRDYPELDYRVYSLAPPLQPGERRTVSFETLLEERGFPNSQPLTRIVENGSFLDNTEITPELGMSRGGLLRDRSKRRKHGLPAELRPAKLEDPSADAHAYLRRDSDWVTAELEVTTDADQVPVAPGTRLSDFTEGGRRTLRTRTDAPIQHFFSIQSARYTVTTDSWTGRDGQPVELAIYSHGPHDHNLRRMLEAMKASLALFSEAFSPFQFHQLRILEFPAYASFAQSFANTIPYSEAIGFIQDYQEAKADSTIDLVTYVTAHEVAHQWWGHQIIGADKQGMTLLSETFAQYSALLVMEKLYGKEQIRKFLKGELDGYLRSRGGEVIEELPLDRVENQPYIHYQKGSLAMYWLKEVVGAEVVNRALAKLLAEHAFKAAPYPTSRDFLRLLRAEAGPQHEQLISDLFEQITLYDLKASAAKASKRPDGKYEVRFTVEGKKLHADGKGKETEAPLDEAIDLGAFSEEPGKKGYRRESVLAFERRPIRSGKQEVALVTEALPKIVGVDPYNKRIDRNSDDNFAKVELTQP